MRTLSAVAVVVYSLFGTGSALAQGAAQTCTVTAAQNATIGGSQLSEGTTVFAGERLATGQNGQIRVQCGTVRLALADNSAMRTFQSGSKTIVELDHGTLLYSTSGNSEDLAIYSLDIRITPTTTQPATGQVYAPNHCQTSVRPTKSTVTVTVGDETKLIEESKSYEVTAERGVDYRDDWKPVLSDYPDYPKEAEYHHSHGHVVCAPAFAHQSGKAPIAAGGPSHFRLLAIGGILTVTGITIHKALESPDKP